MKIFGLCLLAVQVLLLIGIFVLLWQIRGVLRREDLPEDDPLPAKENKFVVTRMRLMCIFLAVGAGIGLLQAVLKAVLLLMDVL